MNFIPVIEKIAEVPNPEGLVLIGPSYKENAAVSTWSVEPVQYGKFLCAIFDEWVRHDVGRCFVQLFDVAQEA